MAISVQIYSNTNGSSRSISFDFVGDVLAASTAGPSPTNAACRSYYFKVTTGARQDNSQAYPARVIRDLSELSLNGAKQRIVDTSNAYSDIRSMIIDYTFDYINGHDVDLFSSGVTEQRPMQF